MTCSPSQGWARYPNLQRRPHSPNLGRGRLQRQIARAFEAHGPEVTTSTIYDWCMLWPVDKRSSQAQRWSIRRILDAIADRRGRASTIGRPWIGVYVRRPRRMRLPPRQIEIIGELVVWPILPILQAMFGSGRCSAYSLRMPPVVLVPKALAPFPPPPAVFPGYHARCGHACEQQYD